MRRNFRPSIQLVAESGPHAQIAAAARVRRERPSFGSAKCRAYRPKLYKYMDLPTISCGVRHLSQANEPFLAYSKVRYRTLTAT